MSLTITCAPSFASRIAVARPMPEPAPVTNATRPSSFMAATLRQANLRGKYTTRLFPPADLSKNAGRADRPLRRPHTKTWPQTPIPAHNGQPAGALHDTIGAAKQEWFAAYVLGTL